MVGRTFIALCAAAEMLLTATAAAQSYSDGYTFLKAVKERDLEKVNSVIAQPGSVVVNSKERGSNEGALHIVARGRDLPWLSYLLGKGARPDLQDGQGNTALAIAAQLGWVEGARLLISRKATVDLANSRGETPLIMATQRRDIEMVRVLLAAGASPRRTDTVAGLSALDYAKQDARAAAVLKILAVPTESKKGVAAP
jgi:ankyrin repeat protein